MKKYSKILPNGLDVPSHTELFRDFHKVEEPFMRCFFLFPEDAEAEQLPKYKVEYEVDGWDIVITLFSSKNKELKEYIKEYGGFKIGIEYKSSIEEQGKQFDAYIRQIKKRIENNTSYTPILFSFDERIEEYKTAGQRAGFMVVFGVKPALDDLKGSN